jgi:hypothetical protein
VSYAWSEMRLLTGSRWLFLLEGLITLVVGLASFFLMPASAVQTKTWFRPNGWFTDRETAIVVNRVLRDDPSKGDMHNRQAITPRRLWHALQDYDLWPVSKMLYPSQLKSNVPALFTRFSGVRSRFSTSDIHHSYTQVARFQHGKPPGPPTKTLI